MEGRIWKVAKNDIRKLEECLNFTDGGETLALYIKALKIDTMVI